MVAFYPKAQPEASGRHRADASEERSGVREKQPWPGILKEALALLREEDAWVAVGDG